jgi:hypothetical protein
MKTRAEQLSKRIENGFETLAIMLRLSESQWSTVIPPDGRGASVIIHRVASAYLIEFREGIPESELFSLCGSGARSAPQRAV